MNDELEKMRAHNKKLKDKIKEQYQVFQEEKNKLKSMNQALRAELYSEQSKNKAIIEQCNAKLRDMEQRLALQHNMSQLSPSKSSQKRYYANPSRFDALEERSRLISQQADEILIRCRSANPNAFDHPYFKENFKTNNRNNDRSPYQINSFTTDINPTDNRISIGIEASDSITHSNIYEFDSDNDQEPIEQPQDNFSDNDVTNDSVMSSFIINASSMSSNRLKTLSSSSVSPQDDTNQSRNSSEVERNQPKRNKMRKSPIKSQKEKQNEIEPQISDIFRNPKRSAPEKKENAKESKSPSFEFNEGSIFDPFNEISNIQDDALSGFQISGIMDAKDEFLNEEENGN